MDKSFPPGRLFMSIFIILPLNRAFALVHNFLCGVRLLLLARLSYKGCTCCNVLLGQREYNCSASPEPQLETSLLPDDVDGLNVAFKYMFIFSCLRLSS